MSQLGHNSADVMVRIEVRLFNSLSRHLGPRNNIQQMEFEAGSTIADIVERLRLDPGRIFYILRNGRDVTKDLHGPADTSAFLEDGDVIALSGPVPYSFGYGAPIM
jgi:sulfur carrier protein ThiS